MSTDDEIGVRVTLKLVYEAVTEVQKSITKLEQSVALNKYAADQDQKRVDDHEYRLRSVERWLYAIPASTLAAVVAAIVAFVK
jgi:hypothetical protein